MKAIGNVLVQARSLEQELEALLFAVAAVLVTGGTIAICLPVVRHWI